MPKTTQSKKRGRPVGSKTKSYKEKEKEFHDEIDNYWKRYKSDEIGVDNAVGVDVPLHLRGGSFQWNFQKRMPWYDKVTWVLTGVNVAILISLVIKNV